MTRNVTDGLFHVAVEAGRLDYCRTYLLEGANVNSKDSLGDTVLGLAARKGQLESCRFLIENGADVMGRCMAERTALHIAVAQAHEVSPAICQLLIDQGADVHAVNKNGETPLHDAMTCGMVEVCEVLLKAGARIDAFTPSLNSPLHSCNWSSRDEASLERYLKVARDAGYSTSVAPAGAPAQYLTPFQAAVEMGNLPMVKASTAVFGDDLEQVTGDGRTLLELTERMAKMKPEVRQWLLAAKAERAIAESFEASSVVDAPARQSSGLSL
jgi:ankyrin repeat protein